MGRTTWSLDDATANRLESVANRKDSESANEFCRRVASMLEGDEDGTDVTESDIAERGSEDTDLLTVEEFDARIDDLEARLPRKNADEIETRLR